ncbi:colicin V family bacteriocin [Caproiciproducens sp. MSJ-32]|nr:colicin V family bacteriocin [Caproiciproducens sp. MSJ-32]
MDLVQSQDFTELNLNELENISGGDYWRELAAGGGLLGGVFGGPLGAAGGGLAGVMLYDFLTK